MSRRFGGGGGRGGRGGRGRDDAASVFIRNLHHECRQDDVREVFQKYGDISDVYIPLDYHTREPRGICYVQYGDYKDAEEAVYHLDGTSLYGRVLEVQVAQGDRKTPSQMRYRGGGGNRRGRSFSRSRSRSRSPRRRHNSGGRERRSRSRSKSRSPSNHPSDRKRTPSKSRSRSKSR